MLKNVRRGPLHLVHRIPETLSLVILKMATPVVVVTLPATTTILPVAIHEALLRTTQDRL